MRPDVLIDVGRAKVLVDGDAPDWVFTTSWYINGAGYVKSPWGDFLHKKLVSQEIPTGYLVQHTNGNRLDCRRQNLKVVSQSINMLGVVAPRKDNTSGVKGVTWHKRAKKWQAQIGFRGRNICIGQYKNKEDAIKARIEFHQKLQDIQDQDGY